MGLLNVTCEDFITSQRHNVTCEDVVQLNHQLPGQQDILDLQLSQHQHQRVQEDINTKSKTEQSVTNTLHNSESNTKCCLAGVGGNSDKLHRTRDGKNQSVPSKSKFSNLINSESNIKWNLFQVGGNSNQSATSKSKYWSKPGEIEQSRVHTPSLVHSDKGLREAQRGTTIDHTCRTSERVARRATVVLPMACDGSDTRATTEVLKQRQFAVDVSICDRSQSANRLWSSEQPVSDETLRLRRQQLLSDETLRFYEPSLSDYKQLSVTMRNMDILNSEAGYPDSHTQVGYTHGHITGHTQDLYARLHADSPRLTQAYHSGQTQAFTPRTMREFRRNHSEPRRRRSHGAPAEGQCYDSVTDKLVRDVVRFTFFGGETTSPTKSRGNSMDNNPVPSLPASPAKRPTFPEESHHPDQAGLRLPRPVVRWVSSPNTIYSSGYESDRQGEHMATREEDIDALFYNHNHSTITLGVAQEDNTELYHRDEFILSPDDLYIENQNSFCQSPSKHQRHAADMMTGYRTPIKGGLNSCGRGQQAHQGPTVQGSVSPRERRQSRGKARSPSHGGKARQSPSQRKLNKVVKSMRYIISDLDTTATTATTTHLPTQKPEILETDLDSSDAETSFTSPTSMTSRAHNKTSLETNFSIQVPNSPIQVPLTSTPVQSMAHIPTVTYSSQRDLMGDNGDKHHLAVHNNQDLSASMVDVCEQPALVHHVTYSWPPGQDNDSTHNGPSQEQHNHISFKHHPFKLDTLTPDIEDQESSHKDRELKCIKERHSQRSMIPQAHYADGHFSSGRQAGRMCDSQTMGNSATTAEVYSLLHTTCASSFTHIETSLTSRTETSLLTTAMLQQPSKVESDVTVSELSVTDLYPEESVQSIRVRPKELMFDEDYYLRPRTLEFNTLRSSGSESSLCDGTLLLNHLQNSEFWNSQRSTVSSIPSSPRNSTVSSDSGRGSTGSASAMDINELRCDDESELDNSFLYDADAEPIYETIPDHLVSDETCNDSDVTLCEDLHAKKQIENTYATIDGDLSEGYVMCSSFHGYDTPPEPPVRNLDHSRMTLPIRSSHHQQKNSTRGSWSRRQGVRMSQGIKRTDVISHNRYHVYTVGDVLESFHRLASNIPVSPPRVEHHGDSLNHNVMRRNVMSDDVPLDDVYAEIRKPCRVPPPPPSRSCDSDTQTFRKHTSHKGSSRRDPKSRDSRSFQGHRSQSQRHRSSYHRNSDCIPGRRSYSHQRAPGVKTVTVPNVEPVWRSNISQLQGTLC